MKRDMDLIRKMLLEIEGQDGYIGNLAIPGYSQETIGGHVRLLFNAGFCEGKTMPIAGSTFPIYMITGLTWAGHDFLDDIRNESVWAGVKETLKRFGGDASLEVIKSLAAQAAIEFLKSPIF